MTLKSLLSLACPALVLAVSPGCFTHPPPDELAQAVAGGEHPVAMKGEAAFFDGKVSASITISRGIGRGTNGAPGGGGKRRRSESQAVLPDIASMEQDDATAYMRAKAAVGSPLPPVTIHFVLGNKGTETVSVEVIDFDSDLGNFAVHPSVLSLAADQTAEPDPMISQLGVTSDEIAVKVTLKVGGKKETQSVLVKNLMGGQTQVK